MIYSGTNSTVKCSFNAVATGLAGTAGVQILDNAGNVIKARTTSGIAEHPTGSGIYFVSIDLAAIPAAPAPGHYYLLWDNGAVTPGNCATEDLILLGVTTFATALRGLQSIGNTTNAENISVGFVVG